MLRPLFVVFLLLHGLIHLLGFAKGRGWAALPQLTQPISPAMGMLWLAAALLLVGTGVAVALWPRWWWALGLLALVASQWAIASSWGDAKWATLANLLLLLAALHGLASQGPWSLREEYRRRVEATRPASSSERLSEADLAPLPAPVQRYLRAAGVVGQRRPRSVHARWTGRIRADAVSPWMAFTAEQVNTFDPPRRFFKMDAIMKGLPVDVLHAFDEGGATMRVKLLSAVTMVDAKGADLTRAETVTLFNDLCILAPGALVSPLVTWEPVDDRRARARFTLRGHTVGAELRFDEAGDLVDFVSDDRSAGSPDGKTFTPMRWSTPLSRYAQVGPARVATRGDAVWHPATGAFAYGEFELASLAYDEGR